MQPELPDLYAILDVDRRATPAQIRTAYRLFAKQSHPDLNPTAEEERIQQLNAAYEILGDPARRRAYDRERDLVRSSRATSRAQHNVSQNVYLRIEDFMRGTMLDVSVKDPANVGETEQYRMTVPPMTVPGTKFRFPRGAPFEGGFVEVRVRALPGFRFKLSGSNLRMDLRITVQRGC